MDEKQLLKKENEELKNKVIELEERLKKYTAPARHKKYYEENKEEILKKQKEYVVSSEKKKEYARRAYLKKKDKNIV
jgi:hypothetical protein